MDPIVTTNVVQSGQQQDIKPAADQENGTMVSADFETFLRMLTTQLENQDPLNPMESSDFAVQLATFSGVEQQVQSNDLLSALVSQSDAVGLADLASWVGMEARSPATLFFDGTSLEITPDIAAGATRAMLVVKDTEGAELGRFDIPNDGEPLTWLGTGSDGQPLPPGSYQFFVEGFSGQERISNEPLETFGTVREVQMGPTGPVLILDDGSRVLGSDVTAVRAPE